MGLNDLFKGVQREVKRRIGGDRYNDERRYRSRDDDDDERRYRSRDDDDERRYRSRDDDDDDD